MPDNEQPKAKAKDEYRLAPDALNYYANNVRFETTPWDLRLLFGELAGNLPTGGSIVEQKAVIKLSWAQAKVMAIFLAINVADHEAALGAERLPAFVFGEPLKHLGDKDLTLEEMFLDIMKAVDEQRQALPKS
jgi:hypothetical protein